VVCSKPPTNGVDVGAFDSLALVSSSSLTSFKICSFGYLGFFFSPTFFHSSALLPLSFLSFKMSFGKTVGLKVSLG